MYTSSRPPLNSARSNPQLTTKSTHVSSIPTSNHQPTSSPLKVAQPTPTPPKVSQDIQTAYMTMLLAHKLEQHKGVAEFKKDSVQITQLEESIATFAQYRQTRNESTVKTKPWDTTSCDLSRALAVCTSSIQISSIASS